MTYKQHVLFQGLLEAMFPVLGYFFWGWDFYFILLFYVIDVLLSIVLTGFKIKKRIAYIGDSEKYQGWKKYTIYCLSYLAVFVLLGFIIQQLELENRFSWLDKIGSFLMHKDMGLPQGILLFPLLTLSGIMLYRTQFLMQARYRTTSVVELTQPMLQQILLLLSGSGLYLVVQNWMPLPEFVLVFTTVLSVTCYRVFVLRLS